MFAFRKHNKFKRVLIALAAVVAPIVLTVSATLSHPDLRWRAQVVALKLSGALPDVEFVWLIRMLQPGSPVYLESLAATANPHTSIKNPYTSDQDISEGKRQFREHCSACHDDNATGDSFSLFRGEFSYGASDWALFRNTIDGVAHTSMPPIDVPDVSAWQMVAYIRSESEEANGEHSRSWFDFSALKSFDPSQIANSSKVSGNWLTYSGSLDGQRFSHLDQISKANVSELKLAWVYQGSSHDYVVESTPIAVEGLLITTEPPGSVLAINAETGNVLWRYVRDLPSDVRLCCGPVNRGVAISGTRVFVGTLDAHIVALDIESGRVIWDVETADHREGYSNTAAPIVVNDKVIVGVAGGEFGIRGFVDAYDIDTGTRLWRFHTIPAPGEFGAESWSDDSWRTGGGPTWMTGSYSQDTKLTYWGIGNPGPDFNADERRGDNLFTNSLVALDVETGALQWHFQFTPEDVHDYDANHVPVIADVPIDGISRKVVLSATKNGFFYVLDATNGQFLRALQIANQTWAKRIDANGRPIRDPASNPTPTGTVVYPGAGGGANWWPPSFNPNTGIYYLPVLERGSIYYSSDQEYEAGDLFLGGSSTTIPGAAAFTVLRAIDVQSNQVVWETRGSPSFELPRTGGALSTASGIQFWANAGHLMAIEGTTGDILWSAYLGGATIAGPMTYMSGDRQYIAISAGRGLFAFAL